MKKYALIIALASVVAAPGYAQLAGETNVMKTETAVERAAREQGFSSGGTMSAPAPQVIENSSVLMMAPEAPAEVQPTQPAHSTMPVLSGTPAPSYSGSRPSLIKNDLPAGLVMNGPGTEAYKKKHRKKKKKKVAVEQVAPAPVEEPKKEEPQPEPPKEEAVAPAPEPAPELAPVAEEPPAMPDVTATPPLDQAPEPQPDPFAQPDPAPDMPAPGAPPSGSLQPPDDPFATPPAP